MSDIDISMEKSKWIRWLLDGLLILSIALLSWAGTVLWSLSNTQIEIATKTEAMGESLVAVQENQKIMVHELTALKLWRAETSANRFTADDGHEIWLEISKVREHLAKLPTQTPPDWFVAEFRKLEDRVSSLEKIK